MTSKVPRRGAWVATKSTITVDAQPAAGQAHVGCGCGVQADDGRKAIGVDPEAKVHSLKQLRRIE